MVAKSAATQWSDKFGAETIDRAPLESGVYLFRDVEGQVIYVGKAKSLRRRLARYRNAGRKKRDRKARAVTKMAASVEWEITETERGALLRENELIQRHRPSLNVADAYWFLYPVIGITRYQRDLALCLTTVPDDLAEAWPRLDLEWFGAYRGRRESKEGFYGLVRLLERLGHREKRPATDRAFSPVPYSKLVLIRRLADAYDEGLARLLAGEAADVLGTMALALVDIASARRDASTIQADLAAVQDFYELEARRLRMLRESNDIQEHFVPQAERDRLRIRAQDLAR